MASANFSAEARNETGKGVARKMRAAGKTPGVVYGHGREPLALSLDTRDFERMLDKIAISSTVIDLAVGGTTSRTLIREIQRHPYKKQILHVDFQELVAGEKVTVDVPLVYVGVPEGVRVGGGILDQVMHEITVHVDPSSIPNHVDVDVSGLTIGHGLHVSDLKVPAGVEILDEQDATVCMVSAPRASETPVAGVAVVEAAAEPELIRKTKEEGGEEEA
jgi:large subunit ribosomal protein L25